jgi:hypothetical protein
MKVFTFSEARQQFSTILDLAQKDGSVKITHRDGRDFIIQPVEVTSSPLAVPGIDLSIPKAELLEFIHEGRRI